MTEYFWCLTHNRVETERDDVDNCLGPFPSAEAAQNHEATHEAREDRWEAQERADAEWEGRDLDE